eukprot:6425637-Amphidinium_carterae.1
MWMICCLLIVQLSKKILLTVKCCPFVYCGKQVRQLKDGTIEVDQNEAIATLEQISIPSKRQLDSPCSPSDLSELRRVIAIGSIQWLARQTRYDVLCGVALLAQRVGAATIADLKTANSLIKELQSTPECVLRFSSSAAIPYLSLPPVGVHDVESAELLHEPVGVPYMFAVADSAHANVGEEKVSSQAGYVIGVRTGNHFHPLDVTSFKIKR